MRGIVFDLAESAEPHRVIEGCPGATFSQVPTGRRQ